MARGNINTLAKMKGGNKMVSYEDISFRELKAACVSANVSKLLPENIRHVGVKGEQVYANFISVITALPDDVKAKLPEDVIDYYNNIIDDEPALGLVDVSDGEREDPGPESDPDSEIDPDSGINSDPDITPTPARRTPRKAPKPPKKKTEDESAKTGEDKPEPTIKKTHRLSKTPMTPTVEGGKLIINFKELKVKKTITLPKQGDFPKLKIARKKAMDFATENGATNGQLCNISKTLNLAGYYMR